tara:strand:+ start:12384 stop:12572 length:189 start_codon:yes stop_codon:yes gene_type:complete
MITIVSFSVQSAYGRESGRFDAGMSLDVAGGCGNDFVAFGSIRNVDAGASTLTGTGPDVLEV